MKQKLKSRLLEEIIASDVQMTPPLQQNPKKKNLLMKVKEESEKDGLKVNIHKTKITVSSPNTSRQIHGKIVERVRDFNFGAPKSLQIVTAPMKFKDTCSLESSIALIIHASKVMLKILQASFRNM